VPVRRARERAGRADERAGDHTADAHAAADDLERFFADPVLLVEGNHVFVRGNLKDAVGGGVDDRLPGPDVLRAQPLNDLRA
jgi:hypothetical protein